MTEKESTLVEVARSFSYKKNLGNYENKDYFCSLKAECQLKDFKRVSESLFFMCKEAVMRDVEKDSAVNRIESSNKAKTLDRKESTLQTQVLELGEDL